MCQYDLMKGQCSAPIQGFTGKPKADSPENEGVPKKKRFRTGRGSHHDLFRFQRFIFGWVFLDRFHLHFWLTESLRDCPPTNSLGLSLTFARLRNDSSACWFSTFFEGYPLLKLRVCTWKIENWKMNFPFWGKRPIFWCWKIDIGWWSFRCLGGVAARFKATGQILATNPPAKPQLAV